MIERRTIERWYRANWYHNHFFTNACIVCSNALRHNLVRSSPEDHVEQERKKARENNERNLKFNCSQAIGIVSIRWFDLNYRSLAFYLSEKKKKNLNLFVLSNVHFIPEPRFKFTNVFIVHANSLDETKRKRSTFSNRRNKK